VFGHQANTRSGGYAEARGGMYMYMCLAVFSFLWRGGRRGGREGAAGGFVEVGASSLCADVLWGRCIRLAFGFLWIPVVDGWQQRFIAPPSSLLRLNPSISIPKEGDNLRSPFQAIVPCDLAMLPMQLFAWRNLLV
jgi:hypothetical protein